MAIYWVSALALSNLLYVLLDGFDLGVGILYGFAQRGRSPHRHDERCRSRLGRQRDDLVGGERV